VDPSEYDYVAQFTQTVKWANKNKEHYPPTDVGKVWGLVASHRRLERENAALREVLTRWKEICEMGLPDVVMPSLKPALVELWDATDAAINAARKEGGAS
jgi:hypothetical protein